MSQPPATIQMPESFSKLFFATQSHLGGNKITNRMKQYVYAQRKDGVSIFDINQSWSKFVLAARAIAAVSFPETVCAVSGKIFGRKPVLKFAESIGCRPITSRFIPGTFTNTKVRGSIEPRLIIVSDPTFDKQAVIEASMANCPVIAFCNTDNHIANVDIVVPVNNRSSTAIASAFFILSRLVNYMRFGHSLEENIKNVELFFYRTAPELESLQKEQAQEVKIQFAPADVQIDSKDFGKVESAGSSW